MDRVRSADGTEIAYERRGSGPPLVLIGGALSGRSAGAGYAEALAGAFMAISYDRRGRGSSGDTPPYAVEREVEDVVALIEVAGGRAYVYGHSSGAVVALEAARTLGPEAIPRLAIYEPPFIVDDSRPAIPHDARARVEELVAAGRRGEAVEYFLRTGPLLPSEAVAASRASQSWPMYEAVAHTLAYDLQVMNGMMGGSPEALERFTTVEVPALVADGGASAHWMHAGADAIAAVLPHADRRTIEGHGHGPPAESIAPVLVAFLADDG